MQRSNEARDEGLERSLMMNTTFDFANPYPFYTHLREHHPVSQNENGTWHLTRYQDVSLLLSDKRFGRKSPISQSYVHINDAASRLDAMISKWSLFNDPPVHTHLRKMLSEFLTPRRMKDTKDVIESIVDTLITSMMQKDHVNFMEAFAYQLPISVINHLLGSSLDVATVRKWSFAVASAMDHGYYEQLENITPTIISMYDYFRQLVLEREANTGQDWISEMVKLKHKYQLGADDIISNSIFLLLAAHETLQLTLGLGVLTLANHPEQLLLLQNNLDLAPLAVEEILRYEAPWTKLSRWTYEDVIIDDIVIPKHQLVVGVINAANRDPARFTHPDVFDITRTNNRHFSFGYGIHLCHGALLARLEMQCAFSKLAPLFNRMTIMKDQIEWFANSSLRYITNLPIRIDSYE